MDFYFKENEPYVKIKINGTEIDALVDTGSHFSGLPNSTCKALGLTGVGGHEFDGLGTGEEGIELPLYLCEIEVLGKTSVICVAGVPETLEPIFGRNELSQIRLNLDWKEKKINAEDC